MLGVDLDDAGYGAGCGAGCGLELRSPAAASLSCWLVLGLAGFE